MGQAEVVKSSRNGQVAEKRPNPEVVPKAARRRFGAEYKLRVLGEADQCTGRGEIRALLGAVVLGFAHGAVLVRTAASGPGGSPASAIEEVPAGAAYVLIG